MSDEKSKERKESPIFSGVLQYFPLAMFEVSKHSKKGNDKHNPGEPLRWAKEKSTDHADCIARHLIDIGPNWDSKDQETDSYHATALAWRALALLQTILEREKRDTPAITTSPGVTNTFNHSRCPHLNSSPTYIRWGVGTSVTPIIICIDCGKEL